MVRRYLFFAFILLVAGCKPAVDNSQSGGQNASKTAESRADEPTVVKEASEFFPSVYDPTGQTYQGPPSSEEILRVNNLVGSELTLTEQPMIAFDPNLWEEGRDLNLMSNSYSQQSELRAFRHEYVQCRLSHEDGREFLTRRNNWNYGPYFPAGRYRLTGTLAEYDKESTGFIIKPCEINSIQPLGY